MEQRLFSLYRSVDIQQCDRLEIFCQSGPGMAFDAGDEPGAAQGRHNLAHTAGISVYAFRNTVAGQGTVRVQHDESKDVDSVTEFC